MAEEKEPERKKLSLQGNKKLSLGSGQDFLKATEVIVSWNAICAN